MMSNAPPQQMVLFVKTLAAKLAGSKKLVSTRTKLHSELGNATETVSPVTSKDIENMRYAEAGGKGEIYHHK